MYYLKAIPASTDAATRQPTRPLHVYPQAIELRNEATSPQRP